MKSSVRASCDKKIAIIGRLDQPGGVQSVIISLIKGLNRLGIIPDIVWDVPPSRDLLEDKGVMAGYLPIRFRLHSRKLDPLPITARYLLRAANVIHQHQVPKKYDFYYIFYNGFLVTDGTPHVRYLSGPPLIPQLETISPGLRGVPFRLSRRLYHRVLRKRYPVYEFHPGSRYVINSHFTAQLFRETHGVSLPVVHPPIPLGDRPFEASDLADRDTITFFSRFAPYKRPEMVLHLARCYPDQRVVLMGGVRPESQDYFEGLERLSHAHGLSNVEFFNTPTGEIIQQELQRTRFYVFPAINEHFGIATVEAIDSGAVPFVHDSGGQREIVPDPRLRFTDDTFSEQFSALLQLPLQELNQIRTHLQDHIRDFSEEVFHQKMLSFIDL